MGWLSGCVGGVCTLAGGKKLVDLVRGDEETLSKFKEYAEVFPLVKPNPKYYQATVGVLELSLGLGLLLGPRNVRRWSSRGLMLVMANATHGLCAQGKYRIAAIPVAFLLALIAVNHHLSKKDSTAY